MEKYYKEPTPVQYSASGIKKHHYLRYRKGVRLHWHDRMELIRLHKGTMLVGYGENTAALEPGQLYIVPPKIPHAVQLLSDMVEYDVLMFDVRRFYNDTDTCQNLLPAIFDGRASFSLITADPDAVRLYDGLFAICEEDDLEAVAQVYRLLRQLFQCALVSMSDSPKGDATVMDAQEFIRENYAQEITLEQLAGRYGYSCAHFCRKFKEATWLTPMNYLKIYRLEEAARQLRAGEKSISDIALGCGFPDSNYFTRCFKRHFGVPPTKYEK